MALNNALNNTAVLQKLCLTEFCNDSFAPETNLERFCQLNKEPPKLFYFTVYFQILLRLLSLTVTTLLLLATGTNSIMSKTASDILNSDAIYKNGDEGDIEVTKDEDLLQKDGTSVHPCANTTVNQTVITPQGDKVLCLVPSENELEKELQAIGGFNRRYVAVSLEQAALDFENPLDPIASNPKPIVWSSNVSGKRRRFTDENEDNFGDEGDNHVRVKRSVKEGLNTCEDKGTLSSVGFRQLCQECWWITKLPENKFPRLINEKICGKDGTSTSIFGATPQFCGQRTDSMCLQRSFTQDLLVQTDDYEQIPSPDPQYSVVYKQVWKTFAQEIRSCCQCQGIP